MDPFCVTQLADDTTITAESLESQAKKFQKVIDYTKIKHQHINTKKTKYMHMSHQPTTTPIILDDNKIIKAVEYNDGYNLLGFRLSYSNVIHEIIEKNLSSKMFNIAKFYAWLEYNKQTPFFVKMNSIFLQMFRFDNQFVNFSFIMLQPFFMVTKCALSFCFELFFIMLIF